MKNELNTNILREFQSRVDELNEYLKTVIDSDDDIKVVDGVVTELENKIAEIKYCISMLSKHKNIEMSNVLNRIVDISRERMTDSTEVSLECG